MTEEANSKSREEVDKTVIVEEELVKEESAAEQTSVEEKGNTTSAEEKSSTAAAAEKTATTTMLKKLPLSGLIGIVKPSGMTSMTVLDTLKPLLASSHLFQLPALTPEEERMASRKRKRRDMHMRNKGMDIDARCPKVGQGGTLDPLAEGVLVVGIGAGTKRLSQFLECTKDYRAIGLLGTTTASYDCDEPVLARKPHAHVTREAIEAALVPLRGAQKQLPPLYSAIRIDGKRLFEYAREGIDPPRKVEPRDITISKLDLTNWWPAGSHTYLPPAKECSAEEKEVAERARRMAGLDGGEEASTPEEGEAVPAAAFEVDMSVSSGTYVRSVVHDVARACGSGAHVVKLVRTRQGSWIMPGHEAAQSKSDHVALEYSLFAQAAQRLAASKKQQKQKNGERIDESKEEEEEAKEEPVDEQGLTAWERALVDRMEAV